MALRRQEVELFVENADIFANYEEKVERYNACRNYIRTPRNVYGERVIHSAEKLFGLLPSGKDAAVLESIEKLFCGIEEEKKEAIIELLSCFEP